MPSDTKYLIGKVCPEGSEQYSTKNPNWKTDIIYMIDEPNSRANENGSTIVLARCMTPCNLDKCKYISKFAKVEDKKAPKKN
jgi:hypothetical protein